MERLENCVVTDWAYSTVDTAMAKKVHTPDIRAAYHDAIPLNRYGEADEIAAAATFLLSDDASFITGQTLIADGGQLACQDNGRMLTRDGGPGTRE